ncbi:MAG TPA: phosphatidylserine/phosphatidylglycerophosphate/cardiolipin synthase family protein, partial [Candidatus Xenobia bacterium]
MIATSTASPRLNASRRPTPKPRPQPSPTDNSGGDNTTVAPYIGGATIFPKAHEMIQNAKQSVQLEMYEFENDEAGSAKGPEVPGAQEQQQLMHDLVDAAQRGVDVQVILDQSKGKNGDLHNDGMMQYLKQNGVNVIAYPPDTVNIDHVKLLVTDSQQALIGGMNWGNHSPVNHDADVLVTGAGARNLQSQIFDQDWLFSGGKLDHDPAPVTSDPKVTPLETAPVKENGGAHSILDGVLNEIKNTKDHAYIEMYTLTHDDVVNELLAAKQRGVDVKVLLDPSERRVNQKAMDTLNQAGIPTKWYAVDTKNRQLLHAKWGEFDNQDLIIGSGNWSVNGLGKETGRARHNHESDVLVHDQDTAQA